MKKRPASTCGPPRNTYRPVEVDMNQNSPQPQLTTRVLTEQIAQGVGVLVADVEKRNSDKAVSAAPKPYTEADALAACIHALTVLKEAEGRSSRNTYDLLPTYHVAGWPAGDRILRFLAARFNVSLIEIQRPACDRAHVDQISPDSFFSALRSSAVSE